MNVICFDMEMNAPHKEIISIGYTIFNVKNHELKCNKELYIKSIAVLDSFIIGLTGIKPETLDALGTTLQEAYETLKQDMERYQVSKFPLQWGLDHFHLRNQLGLNWEDFCFSTRSIDVKSLYQAWAMVSPQGKTVAGLDKACKELGIEFKGRAHNALVDAVNTYEVFKVLTDKMKKFDRIEKAIK